MYIPSYLDRSDLENFSIFIKTYPLAGPPKDYIETMLVNIVGIKLLVERIEAKWNVSQNRYAMDRQGVSHHLRENVYDPNSLQMTREIEELGSLKPDHQSWASVYSALGRQDS